MGEVAALEWACVLCGHCTQNDWVEQWICIKFALSLNIPSSTETIGMIQKATTMGNWWLAASSWPHTHSCITSSAEFFWWNIKSLRWLIPPTAQIWCPATSQKEVYFWAFPKSKITFEREDFRPSIRLRKIQQGSWWRLGKLWDPKVPSWKGIEVSLSCVQCF